MTLKTSPAVAAKLADKPWSVLELLERRGVGGAGVRQNEE
jgi:hypothetical protein